NRTFSPTRASGRRFSSRSSPRSGWPSAKADAFVALENEIDQHLRTERDRRPELQVAARAPCAFGRARLGARQRDHPHEKRERQRHEKGTRAPERNLLEHGTDRVADSMEEGHAALSPFAFGGRGGAPPSRPPPAACRGSPRRR